MRAVNNEADLLLKSYETCVETNMTSAAYYSEFEKYYGKIVEQISTK